MGSETKGVASSGQRDLDALALKTPRDSPHAEHHTIVTFGRRLDVTRPSIAAKATTYRYCRSCTCLRFYLNGAVDKNLD